MQREKVRFDFGVDFPLIALLITFNLVARLLPHIPGIWPIAASALFAGRMVAGVVSCSLIFFLSTNFAVWGSSRSLCLLPAGCKYFAR